MIDLSNYLCLGTIVKTRGLKGTFKVKSSTYFANERYQKGQKMYLFDHKNDCLMEVHVLSYYQESDFDYVTFEEITSLNDAEKYLSHEIIISREDIPSLPKGMYYYSDLKGLKVFDEDNTYLGDVIDMVDYTAQPSFKIKLLNSKQILVPFVEFYIKKIDLKANMMIIHVIEGLIA